MKATVKTITATIACGLLATIGSQAITLPDLPAKEGFEVKGYVHDGTAGVEGVLVSDGYSFATTAADGSYYLAPNPSAYCVFVVIPSGYEIATVDQGIAKHFVTLNAEGETRADFTLNPIGDDTRFSFITQADTQPDTGIAPNCWNSMNTAYKELHKTGTELAAQDGFTPFSLHMGDIIYNTNSIVVNYQRYTDNLKATGYTLPTFATPGNHDRRYKTDYLEATATYRATWGPLWYSFNRGKVHFISFDNVLVETDGEYTKGYDPAAEEWLRKDLAHVDKGSRVVFFAHQPMSRNKAALKAYTPILDILKEYNTLILTGHLHRTFNNFPEYAPTITERNLSALAGYEWRGPCAEDGTPLGYGVYTVDGDQISWRFKWTGKSADIMFRMYAPGDFGLPSAKPEDEKTVLVNVWDWDKDWKVTWTLDGEDMGELPAYDAHTDPWAVYNYNDNPSRPQFEGVKDTYHIFHADVPPTGSKVEVTAADPFGRTYTSSVTLPHIQGGVENVAADNSAIVSTSVYDLGGTLLLTVPADAIGASAVGQHTGELASGCYILRHLHADGTMTTEKQLIR